MTALHETSPLLVVAMGVSATGKTAVGTELADRLGMAFVEGDSHHPAANIEKMEAGTPLTDEDRQPWLEILAELLAEAETAGQDTVLTCSALRRVYRDTLRSAVRDADVFFLHLHAPFEVLEERMSQRTKHFMPTSLLQSQFDTLEPLEEDETGAVVDVSPPLDQVVATAEKLVQEHRGG
ncbi:MAG TPA: gluconokinase [Nocardioidaceae bacterium]|jgi:gluconokinase|nr:gluconokinase [Nocardioidaceae bacterium]